MGGLNHDFLLLDRRKHPYQSYFDHFNRPDAVLLHDDIILYVSDSLGWIKTHIPDNKRPLKPYRGLNLYGPTVILGDGAKTAGPIFQTWSDLFRLGPARLRLTGGYTRIEGDSPESGWYETIKAERKELVERFQTLAGYAEQVSGSRGKFYILHLGV